MSALIRSNSEETTSHETFSKDYRFYKSKIAGLTINIGDTPERDEQHEFVRFTPYEFFDEAKGDHYIVGYLATDEQDAIEVLADDINVEEIKQEEYQKVVQTAKRSKL
jgi:hypothetical protein